MSARASETEQPPFVSALRRLIAGLRPAYPEVEQTCLRASERLGEAIPGLNAIASHCEGLAATLAGGAFVGANEDLEGLAGELARAAEDLAAEGSTLDRLAWHNGAIGKRIEDLLGFTRTMSWLVFTLKIESAPLTKLSADMTAFAENIHRLADTTRRTLEDYQATHFKLETLLRAARSAQQRFQAEHQTRLIAVAAGLRENLALAGERRLAAVPGLKRADAEARALAGRVGETVLALQVGDRTRQRLEHAHDALALIADALEGHAPPRLRDLSRGQVEILAARLCLLQARQIAGARRDYLGETQGVADTLDDFSERAEALSARSRDLFGTAETGEGSFFAGVEAQLRTARDVVAHFGGARAAVDEAAHSVVAIVEDMRRRTAALTDHIVDVTIIGTNALLRSTRLGDQGKGVALIARELRAYGEQTGAIIHLLPAALDGVVEIAAGLTQGGRLDAASIAALQARMSAAIEVFGASKREVEAALAALAGCARDQRGRFTEAGARLRASAEALAGLDGIEAALEAAGRGQTARRPDLDPVLDLLLPAAYTMDAEREIHAEFAGDGPRAAAPKRKPRNEAELVDAILL